MDRDDWQRPLNAEEKDTLRRRIAELKDHPALWAWYLADEPELTPALPQRMREIYQIIRDEDPYHPLAVDELEQRYGPVSEARRFAIFDYGIGDRYEVMLGRIRN